MDDIKGLIEQQDQVWAGFLKKSDSRLSALESELAAIGRKVNRPLADTGERASPSPKRETWIDTKSKQEIPVLTADDRLIDQDTDGKSAPSVGRFLRGLVCGARADDARELADERKDMGVVSDPAGGYTVQGALSSAWIDALRARTALVRAGARTVPMDSSTLTIARVDADPTCYWKAENAAITASQPTLGAVKLDAKTVVCLTKLSLELSQDAANIERILESVITSAMAVDIDSAGLLGKTTDAAGAPWGLINAENRNRVQSIGAPTSWDWVVDGVYELLVDNVPEDRIGALVAHPAVYKKMRKLKTGITNDNTPLQAPQEVAALPKIWTTAAPLTGGTTATGFIADWADVLFGVRKNIQVKVLQEAFMGSNLQVAILAYARVDFVMTREKSLCTLEGITV
jgi:HK97 family phage major capsid protein